jgi:choline-sulfatase
MYDPAEMDLPVGHAPNARPSHPELANLRNFFDYDRYFDERKIRDAKAAYYGLVSFMDSCLGRILAALEASGQADETVVIYVSDHGDMMGDLGFWTKQVMYNASAGVPMIAAGPGVPVGRRVQTGASLLDLAGTAHDVLAVPQPPREPARPRRSLRALAQEPDDPDRTVFSEYHDGGSTTGAFMVRWADWKYVHYVGHPPQLFNLARDRHELRDLAADGGRDAESRAALREGERRLRAICDPDAVNARCFADQKRRIAELGGESACLSASAFNHTPTPNEQDAAREKH